MLDRSHRRSAPAGLARAASLLLLALASLAAPRAFAQIEPLPSGFFSFPAAQPSPPSARSAALGLADRWLGDEPFDNPAAADAAGIAASPLVQHIGRQDLRAHNRDFSDTSGFLDFAGARVGARAMGAWTFAAYAAQPELRLEDNTFTIGELGDATPPATFTSHVASREARIGLAVAWRSGPLVVGIAPEWTHRRDDLATTEQSGGPTSGTRALVISGSAVGGQAGVRLVLPPSVPGQVRIGAALRYLPKLALDGTLDQELASGGSTDAVHVDRASGWEGGVTVAARLAPDFEAFASTGGRTAQDWDGAGVRAGRSAEWSVGGEYHDARDPWTARIGGGIESHDGTPEPRASRVGVGLGWTSGKLRYDLAVLHRSLTRPGAPNSSDDRAVGTVTFGW